MASSMGTMLSPQTLRAGLNFQGWESGVVLIDGLKI